MNGEVRIRPARHGDAHAIAALIGEFASEALMLRRTPEMVEMAIDDYVVGVTPHGKVVACGALKEYSPSLAEVAAIAVARSAHGNGLGKAIVNAVEALALKRGIYDVFALTLQPEFFSAIGYHRVDRARYPEKIRRDCLSCARRFACNEFCYARNLMLAASDEAPAERPVVTAPALPTVAIGRPQRRAAVWQSAPDSSAA